MSTKSDHNSLTRSFIIASVLTLPLLSSIAGGQVVRPQTTPAVTPAPRTSPTPTPAPTPTQSPTPIPQSIATLPELRSKILLALSRPELRRGNVGVKIASLENGSVLFEQNSEKYFVPASNMKTFTVATALARLSPDFRFATSVYANSKPDSNGTIKGDLIIYGRGDPSFSTFFYNRDYYKGMDLLAQEIASAGVKRIEGNIIGDETYFNTDSLPNTWEWEDLQWYYGAEVSTLNINNNSLDLIVRPGGRVGLPATATLLPGSFGLALINRVVTTSAKTRTDISVQRRPGSNIVIVSGNIPIDVEKDESYLSVPRPANVFVAMLKQRLQQLGVVITGQTRAVNFFERSGQPLQTNTLTEIIRHESFPFREIAAQTLKPSQNLFTEVILRAVGELYGDKTDPKKTSEERGIGVVDKFITEAGIESGSVIMHDGSGLSRHNLITPAATVQLFTYMNSHAYAQAWRDSLTIGGIDGTLQSRFRGTRAENNVRGKTGTLDQVSSLSGYITTASGERLVFSVLINGVNSGRIRNATIDEIVLALANFSGRSNQ